MAARHMLRGRHLIIATPLKKLYVLPNKIRKICRKIEVYY
jgi:hypothetical protein